MQLPPQHDCAFTDFKNLIQYNLGSLAAKQLQRHDPLIKDFECLIAHASGQARLKLERIVLLQKNVDNTLVYALHRSDLIDLAQSLLRYATPAQLLTLDSSASSSTVLMARRVYREIDALFEFIEMRFPLEEPIDTSLSDGYRRIAQVKIADRLKDFFHELATKGTDPTLLTILQGPYDQAAADTNGNFLTYRVMQYLLALKAALQQVLQHKRRDITTTVIDVLFRFDFNTPAFFDYCRMDLELALMFCDKEVDRADCLRGYHRRIQGALPRRGLLLIQKQESLLPQLEAMIQHEKADLPLQPSNRKARNRPVSEPLPEEKSHLDIPTEVMSYLLDVVDRSKLAHLNRSLISRLIASTIRSQTGQPIADEYIRKSSYKVEDRVKEKALEALQILGDIIRKDNDRDR